MAATGVLVVHNAVAREAPAHEADVLAQADAVEAALRASGRRCERLGASLDLARLQREIAMRQPALVFNLVESLGGTDRLAAAVPALLEQMGQAYTGTRADALWLATVKPLAKRWLLAHGLPTPPWWTQAPPQAADVAGMGWIVKSVAEQASLGLDDGAVVPHVAAALERIAASRARHGGEWFAERFIAGREFNVSLLAGDDGPRVLPPAEITFDDVPSAKPRIVGYRAKWDASSPEARATPRRFVDTRAEAPLAARLRALALRCWEVFALRGWARVDLRMDSGGALQVLDVNPNPCLAPDAGFAAALARAGIAFETAIEAIVIDASRSGRAVP